MGLGIRGGLVLRTLIAAGALVLAGGAGQDSAAAGDVTDLLERARAFETQQPDFATLRGLVDQAYGRLAPPEAEFDLEQVLELDRRLHAAFARLLVDPALDESQRAGAESYAEWSTFWIAQAVTRDDRAAIALLERGRERHAGTEMEAICMVRIGAVHRTAGRTAEDLAILDEVRELLFGAEGDPFESPAEVSTALIDWFDESIRYLYLIGAYEAADQYLQEFEERCGTTSDQPERVAYMLLEHGLRVALAADHFESARAAWSAAEESGKLDASGASLGSDDFLRMRAATEAELERRGEERLFDPEPVLVKLVASEANSAHLRCNAGITLVQLLIDRGQSEEAFEVLNDLPDPGGEVDLATALAGLRLHFARLDGDPDAFERAEREARAAFEGRLAEWSGLEARHASFLGLAIRSIPLRELLLAQTALAPGAEGGRRAFELVYRTQAAVAGREASAAEVASAFERLAAPGRLTLAFVPSSLGSLVLSLDVDGVRLHELAAYHELTERGRDLERAALAVVERGPEGQRWSALARASAAARDAFLPPELAAAAARARELVVVGAEDFGWPALELFGLDAGAPLGATSALWYAPSLPRQEQLASAWPAASTHGSAGALVLTSPTTDGERGLPPLAFGARERELARRAADGLGPEGEVLAQDAATLAGLRGALAERALLCLVAHGLYDPRRVDPAGLLLASLDGAGAAVFSEQVAALRVPLVVALMACRAGAAPTRRGSARAAHLGADLLDAGAGAVALAPTELDYARSLELGAAFSEALGRGLTVAEAMRAARAALGTPDASAPFDVHPYLVRVYGWAADPLVVGSTARVRVRWLAPSLAVLGVVALAVWLARRRRVA